MSYYSPTFLSPNNTAIIPSSANTFTWQINGTSAQVSYELYIRKVSDNTQIYDSTKISSATGSHSVPGGTMTANTIYKWQVRSWYDGINYTDSDWTIVYADSAPTLTLSATPTTQQNFTVSMLYSHSDSIPVKTYRCKLYLSTNLTTPVLDSGDLYPPTLVQYSSTPLTYDVEGMQNGVSYVFNGSVTTQREETATTGNITFLVHYTYPDTVNELIITPLNNIGAIQLTWSSLLQLFGVVSGTSTYVAGKYNQALHLAAGATLTYTIGIGENFTDTHWFILPNTHTGEFLRFGSDFIIGYNGTKFYYQNQYRITAGMPRVLPASWFFVGITSSTVYIITDTYTEILR